MPSVGRFCAVPVILITLLSAGRACADFEAAGLDIEMPGQGVKKAEAFRGESLDIKPLIKNNSSRTGTVSYRLEDNGSLIRDDEAKSIPPAGVVSPVVKHIFDKPGKHVVRLTVDPVDQIKEKDERNNTYETILEVKPLIDPEIAFFGVTRKGDTAYIREIFSGEKAQVHYSVKNNSDRSLDIKYCVYDNERPLKEEEKNFAPGAVRAGVVEYTAGINGRHIIRMTVDPENKIEDMDREDNSMDIPLDVKDAKTGEKGKKE